MKRWSDVLAAKQRLLRGRGKRAGRKAKGGRETPGMYLASLRDGRQARVGWRTEGDALADKQCRIRELAGH